VLKELDRNELVRWGPKQVVIIAECEPDTLSNNPVDYDPSKLAIPTGEFGFTSEFTRYDDPLTGTPAEIPVPAATGHGPPANSAAPPAPRPSPPPTPPAPGPPLSPPPTAPATAADLDPSTPASRRTRERLLERERAALTRENGELETEIRRLRTANSELRRDLATTETTIAGFGDVEAKLHAQIAALQEKVASLAARNHELTTKNDELVAQNYEDRHKVQAAQAEAERADARAQEAEHQAAATSAELLRVQQELEAALATPPDERLKDRIALLEAENHDLEARLKRTQRELTEEAAAAREMGADVRDSQDRILELEARLDLTHVNELIELIGTGRRLIENTLTCGCRIAVIVDQRHLAAGVPSLHRLLRVTEIDPHEPLTLITTQPGSTRSERRAQNGNRNRGGKKR
jgi:hypothetical protein